MSYSRTPVDVAQLNALLDLINSSVQEIISTYNTEGHDVLALDSTELGPFDSPENTPLRLTNTIQIVEAACAQLCATVAPPGHTMINKAQSFDEPACLRVATCAKVSDHLLGRPEGVHISELASLAGVEPGKLGRALRLLATKHVYREVQPDVYANNRLSMKLLSTDPVSATVGVASDESMKANAHLWDTLQDEEYGPSYAPDRSAFYKLYGKTLFNFYVDHPEYERRFSDAMVGWGSFSDKGILPRIFPWSNLPTDTIICDVGGSTGHALLDLLKVYPGLKIVVQDLETLRPRFDELWSKQYPEAVQQHRTKFVPIDFFKDSPVKDCDFYYIRHILHDWPDDECVKILENVKTAMKPSSRVLIHEYVLQATTRSGVATHGDFAPEPLLPNYGVGRIRRYNQDINMLGFFNAKERTLQEFLTIGSQAGLSFVRLWDSGETALVEFELPA